MNITGALLVGVLQQPINDADDVAIVGFQLAVPAQIHQLFQILYSAGLLCLIFLGTQNRLGYRIQLLQITPDIRRITNDQSNFLLQHAL